MFSGRARSSQLLAGKTKAEPQSKFQLQGVKTVEMAAQKVPKKVRVKQDVVTFQHPIQPLLSQVL